VVAFARRRDGEWVVAVAPRLLASWWEEPGVFPLGAPAWGDAVVRLTAGAPSEWTDALSGRVVANDDRSIRLADAFGVLPVALLAGGSATVPATS
jgi:maltooligosyltrehalose synthase